MDPVTIDVPGRVVTSSSQPSPPWLRWVVGGFALGFSVGLAAMYLGLRHGDWYSDIDETYDRVSKSPDWRRATGMDEEWDT